MPRGRKSKLRARERRQRARAEARAAAAAAAAAAAEGADDAGALGALSVPAGVPQASPGTPTGNSGPGPGAGGRARGPKSKTYPWAAAPAAAPAPAKAAEGAAAAGAAGAAAPGAAAAGAAGAAGQDLLAQKATVLVEYLLYQYKMKEPIRRGDMLKIVHKRYRKDFPDILARARERLQLFFGLELKEAKPHGSAYLLVDKQDEPPAGAEGGGAGGAGGGEGGGGGGAGGAGGGGGGGGWRFPKKGILMPLLSVIFLNGNCASEEEIWAFLNTMGIYDGKSDFIFGEPRKLITQDLVREQYLVYRQVPRSEPPRFEFLWGPRARAETSKMQVLEFLAKLNDTEPAAFAPHYEEALREEQEGRRRQQQQQQMQQQRQQQQRGRDPARARAAMAAMAAVASMPPCKAGGRPGPAPPGGRYPHPE